MWVTDVHLSARWSITLWHLLVTIQLFINLLLWASGYDWSSVGSHTYAWVSGWHGMDSKCSLLPKAGNCIWHWAESSPHAFRFQLSTGLVEGWALVTHLIRRLSDKISVHCSALSIWTTVVYFQYHACLAWVTAEGRPAYLLLPAHVRHHRTGERS